MSLVAELQSGQDHENQKMICMNKAFLILRACIKNNCAKVKIIIILYKHYALKH